ncbi:DUF4340 domain-containing protein [Fusicatenibacter saccharivorans]|uniref:DUF4340 domain-containing protein n=1 Tax=Lachnospiraceae TaxID=186803 RepID=UPI002A9CF184|nr:DUF4340 domain-containing protein [bacterium]MDY5457708.1 DUF4340 domain-containing protein [Bariatricus sp.]
MKKQKKIILMIGVCLILLIGAGVLLGDPDQKSIEKDEKVILLDTEMNVLESIVVENMSGGYCATCENGEISINDLDGVPLDSSVISKLKNCLSKIQSESEVQNGIERLTDFGLDQPSATVTIKSKQEEFVLMLGDVVPDEKEVRYVEWNDKVYTMEESKVEVFFYDKYTFVSKQITPSYEDGSDDYLVTSVKIEGEQREKPLEIKLAESQELAGYMVNSYELVSPLQYPATADIYEQFLTFVFNMEAEEIVKIKPDSSEIEKYDLKEPYISAQIIYQDEEENEKEITLSVSQADEDGNVYVWKQDTAIIYKCSKETVAWMESSEESLVSKTIAVPDIRSLQKLEIYDAERGTFSIEIESEEEESKVFFENQELQIDNFKNYYYLVISLSADEVLFDNLPSVTNMQVSAEIRFVYEDGNRDIVSYYQEGNGKLYATYNNGEKGFRLSASKLELVLSDLQRLISGEKIETRY